MAFGLATRIGCARVHGGHVLLQLQFYLTRLDGKAGTLWRPHSGSAEAPHKKSWKVYSFLAEAKAKPRESREVALSWSQTGRCCAQCENALAEVSHSVP